MTSWDPGLKDQGYCLLQVAKQVRALEGKSLVKNHEYLYWDYGHCRDSYNQAVRMGKWKGIRIGQENPVQLYDLNVDIEEENNVAAAHPVIVRKIENTMKEAVTPSDKYPVGQIYHGKPIWTKNWE